MYTPILLTLAVLSLSLPRTEFGFDPGDGSLERAGYVEAGSDQVTFQAPGAFPATAGVTLQQPALREQARCFELAAAQIAGDGKTLPEIVNETQPNVKLVRDGSDDRWIFQDGDGGAYTIVGANHLAAHVGVCNQLADKIGDVA